MPNLTTSLKSIQQLVDDVLPPNNAVTKDGKRLSRFAVQRCIDKFVTAFGVTGHTILRGVPPSCKVEVYLDHKYFGRGFPTLTLPWESYEEYLSTLNRWCSNQKEILEGDWETPF